jgi:hypothetical protein
MRIFLAVSDSHIYPLGIDLHSLCRSPLFHIAVPEAQAMGAGVYWNKTDNISLMSDISAHKFVLLYILLYF